MSYTIFNMASFNYLTEKFKDDKVSLCLIYSDNRNSIPDLIRTFNLTLDEQHCLLDTDNYRAFSLVENIHLDIQIKMVAKNLTNVKYFTITDNKVHYSIMNRIKKKIDKVSFSNELIKFNALFMHLEIDSPILAQYEDMLLKTSKSDSNMYLLHEIRSHKNYEKSTAKVILQRIIGE